MDFPKLVNAEFVAGYSIMLSFSDGTNGEVDFAEELNGGVFEALKDPAFFRSFSFQPQLGTIEWSNGADFAPEFLYKAVHGKQQRAGSDKVQRRKTA